MIRKTLAALSLSLAACGGVIDDGGAVPSNTDLEETSQAVMLSGGWLLTAGDNVVGAPWMPPYDVDGDGRSEFAIWNSWGRGLLGLNASHQLRAATAAGHGTLAQGGWWLGGTDHTVMADFTGDGAVDFIVKSGWGIGVLTRDAATGALRTLAMYPNGAVLNGGHVLSSSDILGVVGDFDGDGRADFTLGGGGHLNILSANAAGQLYVATREPASFFAGWTENHQARGDFNGDGRDDLVYSDAKGLYLVSRSPVTGRLYTYASVAAFKDTGRGYNTGYPVGQYGGDFDLDGADDLIVAKGDGAGNYWWAILKVDGSTLKTLAYVAPGNLAGSWRVGHQDKILGVADFNRDGRKDILVRSAWGVGVLELFHPFSGTIFQLSNLYVRHVAMAPYGTVVDGGWMLGASDKIFSPSQLLGVDRAGFVVQSGWGLGVIGTLPDGNFFAATLAKADAAVTPTPSAGSSYQASCTPKNFDFCWNPSPGVYTPAAKVACTQSEARSAVWNSVTFKATLMDGPCPAAVCSTGSPTMANMCCTTTGTTFTGVGCSESDAESHAKSGYANCGNWEDGICKL